MFANVLAMFATVGTAVFLTQYLQSVQRLSPFEAALWSLVPASGVLVAAPVSAVLAQRIDRAYVMGGGFVLAAAGCSWMTQIRTDSPLWFVLAAAAVYIGGLVAAMTLANELALGAAPPDRAGSAAAVLESGQELGGALGMAALGSIGAAVYSRDMADALPAGVGGALPGGDADAVRETLGGAAAVAARLPAEAGAGVLESARDAFTHGMGLAYAGAAVVMVGAAAYSFTVLRGTAGRATGSGKAAPEQGDLAPAQTGT